MNENWKRPAKKLNRLGRNATIGFCSSCISDICSNSLRVIKTYRQTSKEKVSYLVVIRDIRSKEGLKGLFGRGLTTRIIAHVCRHSFSSISVCLSCSSASISFVSPCFTFAFRRLHLAPQLSVPPLDCSMSFACVHWLTFVGFSPVSSLFVMIGHQWYRLHGCLALVCFCWFSCVDVSFLVSRILLIHFSVFSFALSFPSFAFFTCSLEEEVWNAKKPAAAPPKKDEKKLLLLPPLLLLPLLLLALLRRRKRKTRRPKLLQLLSIKIVFSIILTITTYLPQKPTIYCLQRLESFTSV